jgi:predicted PolB exonuclease-like 3'-5' exonuclease
MGGRVIQKSYSEKAVKAKGCFSVPGLTIRGEMSTATATYLVLDIETVPDPELFTPPEPTATERPERVFPPLFACQPVVIGALWLDQELQPRQLAVLGQGQDEAAMLAEFAGFMTGHRPHLVTWNGRGFDLPVLTLRSLRHGLSWPWYYRERDYRYRYSDEGHLDLGDFLSDHGAGRMTSLDGAARLIGLPGKDGIDGSQVEGLWSSGQVDSVRNYCLTDVVQTAFLFLRSRLLVGQLDRAAYRRVAEALLFMTIADPRVARLAERADRARLLLG